MYRVKAVGNKVVQRKVEGADQELHKKRLQNIIPSVDTSSPQTYEIGYNFNKKKLQLMEDKYIEIERENRILLEKITNIMQKNQQSQNQQNTQLSPIQRSLHKKSLNEQLRKKQLIKITVENQNILKRLKNPKSEYSVKQLVQQWRQNEKYKNNISEYPESINNINDVNYSNNNNLNQTQIEGARVNPKSAKSFNNQSSDERFQNQSDNLDKQRRSNNRIKNYTKPESVDKLFKDIKILAKKSKKIGLHYYIVQVSLDHGLFKINADDAEHPISKILEMSESEGLNILKKCFQNSIDLLIDNLRISGIENIQTQNNDEQYVNNVTKRQSDNKRQQSIEMPKKNLTQKEQIETQNNQAQKSREDNKSSKQETSHQKKEDQKIIDDKKEIQQKNIEDIVTQDDIQIKNNGLQKLTDNMDKQQAEEIYEEEEFEPE